jgi:preprotein translocase subunit SecG
MLAVDVSFLAVPTVMPTAPVNTLPLQVTSAYISVFFIVGSLVVSLFLTRQNRQYGQESADKAVSMEMVYRL